MEHLGWPKILNIYHHYVVIKNSRSYEKSLWFVAFLLMERENFLHTVGSVLLPESVFFTACARSVATFESKEVVL